MSSTRKAQPGSPMRQERYCSSPEYDHGLMGNLVAKRCSILASKADRELVYFIQLLSHQEGGLEKLTQDIIARFSDRICTKSMAKFGFEDGQIYNREQVMAIRSEFWIDPYGRWINGELRFPLDGEFSLQELTNAALQPPFDPIYDGFGERHERSIECQKHPNSYPAKVFVDALLDEARPGIKKALSQMCLDPAYKLDQESLWYFPRFIESLREYMREWTARQGQGVVVTDIGRRVYDALDYAIQTRSMVLIDGLPRTGKTHAVKAWCKQNPGRARYVQVTATNDDIGFYRAIAKALGLSINLNSKALMLRERIEEVAQQGDLLICFDEAHYLFPVSGYRDALPSRINWIMTALVNFNVPVALITTPQFLKSQRAFERKTAWTSEQFTGRIGHYEPLPDSLSDDDLRAVARVLAPEADTMSIEILINYAKASAKYLAGLPNAVKRARYLAQKEGRSAILKTDIVKAIEQAVIPSDDAFNRALAASEPASKKSRIRALATPLQDTLTEPEEDTETPSRNRLDTLPGRLAPLPAATLLSLPAEPGPEQTRITQEAVLQD